MKRSELCDKIEAAIFNIPNIDASAVGVNMGDIILKLLEKEGMLPPARGVTYDELHAMNMVMPNNEQFRYYHTWEKE